MKCVGVAALPTAVSLNSATKMKNSNGVVRQAQSQGLSNATLGCDLVSFKANPAKLFKDISADNLKKLVIADKNVQGLDDAITRGINVIKKHAVKERGQFKDVMQELVTRRNKVVTCLAADDALKQAKKIAPDSKELNKLEYNLSHYKVISETVDQVLGDDGLTVSPGIFKASKDMLQHVEANGATKYMEVLNGLTQEASTRAFSVFKA